MTPAKDKELSDLMRAVLAGDDSGYAQLLNDIACVVRAIAQRKIGPGAGLEPEDIVQETLLAIHLKRHTWRPDQPIGPWIYAIARYKIIDAYRRRGRRIELDISDFADTLAEQEKEIVMARDIQRALDCLSDGQRQVVSAISVDGASISDTAKRLGMKETAVRVSLHRGLAAIAAKFGKLD
ncbi:sigma-70 family RNA polymerase sigma factor [Pelagibacterium lentulum]|uniref:RNA polymerase sigma factor n=1 Tax=Pelagibacterium lentulum TaxID=2029865 RepID=A0A916R5L7_9HYPH|nr:sigma-70 family RNA polymerase sigma factor [Pelagibacterium lentulum]GGA39181.1 RNA polymerase sigma factor [Pelagibacterium lentulum]